MPLAVTTTNSDSLLSCVTGLLKSSSLVEPSKEWLGLAELVLSGLKILPENDKNIQKKV